MLFSLSTARLPPSRPTRPQCARAGTLVVKRSAGTRRRLEWWRPNEGPTSVSRVSSRERLAAEDGLRALTTTQAAFILEYEANGWNATRAYMRTHPNCRSAGAAAVEGMRTLRNPKVARALEQVRKDRAMRLAMDADEAAMLIAICARADIRHAYDHDGRLLPVQEWPDEFARAVKTIKPDGTIVLHDGLKACITILQMHGRLRPAAAESRFDHVGYLAALSRR